MGWLRQKRNEREIEHLKQRLGQLEITIKKITNEDSEKTTRLFDLFDSFKETMETTLARTEKELAKIATSLEKRLGKLEKKIERIEKQLKKKKA